MRKIILTHLAFLAILPPARADVRETITENGYVARGASSAEVRSNMNLVRPKGFDAFTTWTIRWNYTYRHEPGRCAIATVTTALALAYAMPRIETQNAAVRKSFDAYLVKLRVHEDGHADIGRGVARKIDAGIAVLQAPDCETLGKNANALGQRMIQEGSAVEKEYDRKTDHGRTQGARWP